MAYALAWVVYLLMAALIMAGFERYLGAYCSRQWRLFIRALLALIFFTPGVDLPGVVTPGVVTAGGGHMVPACIGVLLNLLAKSGDGLVKASLPVLAMAVVVFGALFVREILRKPSKETVDVTPQG